MNIRGFITGILGLAAVLVGADSEARVFYCGSIEFTYDEQGSYRYDDRPERGGYTKDSESVITRYGGRWPICLKCSGEEGSPIFACGGQSVAAVQPFQFSMHEAYENQQAGDTCHGRFVRPGSLSREIKDSTGTPPDEVPISAMLSVLGSEYHFMVGPVGDRTPQISVTSHWEKMATHPCAPPEAEQGSHSFQLPLVVMVSASQPWIQGDHLSGVAPIQDVRGCENSDAAICKRRGEGKTANYSLQSTARWSLKRRVTDCTARVTAARGDVKLNGEPVPASGEVPLGLGDVITTGRGARAEFKIRNTSVMRVGSGSQIRFNRDMCDPKPSVDVTDDLLTGPAGELLLHVLGSERNFTISTSNSVVGVRGSRESWPNPRWSLVSAAQAADVEDAENADRVRVPADWPSSGRVVYLKSEESGLVVVKALRGRVRVEDRDAKRHIELKPDEIYRSPAISRKNPVRVTVLGKGSN